MKVRLSPEVVSDASALSLLDDILRFFETGRHEWVVDDIEVIERSQWVEQASERHGRRILDLLQKTVTEAVYGGSTPTIELEIGTGDGRVEPSHAWDAMSQPAYLVVENATSDGRFLRAVIHAYGYTLLETALSERWLEIDQAGGVGEITKRVGALVHERSADRRRVQALVDSDRRHPGHESDTVRSMRALEQERSITVHVLHKRDSENYLPLDAIAHAKHGHKRFQQAYKAFCQLSPQEQDHFDMKKGFGADCGRWFVSKDGKVPYYIDRSTLEARCSTKPGELPAILSKIEEAL